MRSHAGGRILALEEDVTVTEKDGIITCTLTNRSYGERKSFFLPGGGKLLSAVLLSGDGVVPGTRFRESSLEVRCEGDRFHAELPEHSIAVIRFSLSS